MDVGPRAFDDDHAFTESMERLDAFAMAALPQVMAFRPKAPPETQAQFAYAVARAMVHEREKR